MKYQQGQALIEFILIVPFLLLLLILPFILSDMMEKKYRHQIAVGNFANIDKLVDEKGDVSEDDVKKIADMSMGSSVEGDLGSPTIKYSKLVRPSIFFRTEDDDNSTTKLLTKITSPTSPLYNGAISIEEKLSKNYSYLTDILGRITGLYDTDSISKLESYVHYTIDPTEIDLLLKTSNPNAQVGESSPLNLDFASIHFNETLTGYHPKEYTRGGLLGWALGQIKGRTKWGGTDYKISWGKMNFKSPSEIKDEYKEWSEKVSGDPSQALNATSEILAAILPAVDSKDKPFSIACPYQYRASNSCKVGLAGVGESLYAQLIVLFSAIATLESLVTFGTSDAGKEAVKQTLKAMAKKIIDQVIKEVEQQVEREIKEQERKIAEKILNTIKKELKDILEGQYADELAQINEGLELYKAEEETQEQVYKGATKEKKESFGKMINNIQERTSNGINEIPGQAELDDADIEEGDF